VLQVEVGAENGPDLLLAQDLRELSGAWPAGDGELRFSPAHIVLVVLFQTAEKHVAAGPGQLLFLDTKQQVILDLIIGQLGSRPLVESR